MVRIQTALCLLMVGGVLCAEDKPERVLEVRPELPELPQNTSVPEKKLIPPKPVLPDQPVPVPEIEQDAQKRKPIVRQTETPEKEKTEQDWLVEGMRQAREAQAKREAETKAKLEAMQLELYPQLFTLPGQSPTIGPGGLFPEANPTAGEETRVPGAMADPSTSTQATVVARSYTPALPGLTAPVLNGTNTQATSVQTDIPTFSWAVGTDEGFAKAETAPPSFGDFSGFNRSATGGGDKPAVSFGGKIGEAAGGVLPFRKLDPGAPAPLAEMVEMPGTEPVNTLPPPQNRPVLTPSQQRNEFPRLGPRREIAEPSSLPPF
jgi:hypothetical protein